MKPLLTLFGLITLVTLLLLTVYSYLIRKQSISSFLLESFL